MKIKEKIKKKEKQDDCLNQENEKEKETRK